MTLAKSPRAFVRAAKPAQRLAMVLGLALAAGCGPIQSTAYLLDAEVQIEAARTAGAEKLAPYEWTGARLYIHKAREEVGHSNFEQGVEFAQKASKLANAARERSVQTTQQGEAVPSAAKP